MDIFDIIINFWPKFLEGAIITLELAFIGGLIAAILSPPLAIWRLNAGWVFQAVLRVYVSFVRGTPILAQLFLIYYGSGQFRPFLQDVGLWTFFREPFNCAMLTFVLNSTAYQMEILRGGLMGVPQREIEAADAIAMNRFTKYRRVMFPHAYRIAWPALGNEIILLIKASALASVVTVFDLMGQTRLIFSKTFDLTVYIWAAVIYLCITAIFVIIWQYAERLISPQIFGKRSGWSFLRNEVRANK
jgi:polar amino acid transport system permease protein